MAISLILLDLENGGVKVGGDSTLAGFENLIVVSSFSWSFETETVEKKDDKPVTTAKSGKLSLKKNFDRSSPALFKIMNADDGKTPLEGVIKFMDLTAAVEGNKLDAVLEIELKGCHIDSISLRSSDSGKSVEVGEDVVISFEESISLDYRTYDPAKRSRGKAVNSIIKPAGNRK